MNQRIETSCGAIEGRADGEVIAFLGVPYARPPVGALRFQAPVPCEPWVGVREAVTVGPAAPQYASPLSHGLRYDEDCLYLNVWTPALDGRKRPVMVWIHGGAFISGSGGEESYNGAILAQRADVVVVTINYRLGALGFSHVADVLGVEAGANNGLRDQQMALTWVRDHADRFGGDPHNITVFGQSAGGMSIGALMSAPSARGLFQRAIVQSGSAHMVTTRDDANRMAEILLRTLGIDRSNASTLWQRPFKDIQRAQLQCMKETVMRGTAGAMQSMKEMTLVPFGDDDLLPLDPYAAIAAGSARDVDLIVGTTTDEWNFWLYLVDQGKQGIDEATLHKLVDRRSGGHATRLVAAYRQADLSDASPVEVFAAIESDRVFTIPALRLAEAQSRHREAVHAYLFDWRSGAFEGRFGAPHAIDLPYTFGNFETALAAAFVGDSDVAVERSCDLMDAWTDFARDGRARWRGVEAWPRYTELDRATLYLGDTVEVQVDPRGARRRAWDGIQ